MSAHQLAQGESINGRLMSPDGRYVLVMQADGNLVLYVQQGPALWSTGTQGRTATRAVMQDDGNFVLYGPEGALWATWTQGHPGASLVLQNDGNIVVYDGGNPLWSSGTNLGSLLIPGEQLTGRITSPTGRYELVMQGDGNLVLYTQQGSALWSTRTQGRTVTRAVMQDDGNFVLYGPEGALWATWTQGHPGAFLVVRNDGNIQIHDGRQSLWESGSNFETQISASISALSLEDLENVCKEAAKSCNACGRTVAGAGLMAAATTKNPAMIAGVIAGTALMGADCYNCVSEAIRSLRDQSSNHDMGGQHHDQSLDRVDRMNEALERLERLERAGLSIA